MPKKTANQVASVSKAISVVFFSMACLETFICHAEENSTLIRKGEDIAVLHCARCHVVGSQNPFGGISSTPSFSLLINGLEDGEERFQSFHNRLPHPSIVRFKGENIDPDKPVATVPIELEYADIDALVAYAKSLRKEDR